ncbi:hypothetical protein IJ843_00880 [bacterium]|nr:hypothetical protein [bacterium]
MKKQLSLALVSTFLITNASFAATNYNFESANQQQTYTSGQPLRGYLVSVPAGAVVPVVTTQELASNTLTQGQMVQLALGSDFYYDNKLIAPAGSTVTGTVTTCKKATWGGINGKLKVTFTQITTPQGVQIPINGVIKTNDGTGLLVGGTKLDVTKEYAKDAAAGAAIGALSGVVFGALAGGSVGQGAALGTAVGAGGGLVKGGATKGTDVTVPANSSIDIILTQPITVQPSSYSYEE